MGRAKIEYTEQEVEEIILLKLKELGGIKSRLSYNNVTTFNKKIANNEEYRRANGELFKLYGWTFWGTKDKETGLDYYGRAKIDEIKNNSNVIVAGEEFKAEIQDILTLVDSLHNKPDLLAKRLVQVFDRDRSKLRKLETENERLTKQNELLNTRIKLFEKGFVSLFFNSSVPNNSLENVMSLNSSRDGAIFNEMKNMFNGDESRMKSVLNSANPTSKPIESQNNVLNLTDTEDAKKARREAYKKKLGRKHE